MKQPVVLAVLLLAGMAVAQGRGPQPQPQPRPPAPPQVRGIPMTPPPVNHPALAGQPLLQPDAPPRPAPAAPKPEEAAPKPKPIDPDTTGPKVGGKELKKVVMAVASLKWNEDLTEARADSAATGKPILLVQALGEIDGFA